MNDWLKSLKVGDAVIVEPGIGSRGSVERVTKIAPKGQISVGRREFRPDGFERTTDRWNRAILREATPEAVAEVRLRDARDRLARVDWYRAADEQVRAVASLLWPGGKGVTP